MRDDTGPDMDDPLLLQQVVEIMLALAPDDVIWLDGDCRIRRMSGHLERLLGISPRSADGAPCRETLRCRDTAGNALCDSPSGCGQLMRNPGKRAERRRIQIPVSELARPFESAVHPLSGRDGEAAGVIRFFRTVRDEEEPGTGEDAAAWLSHEFRTPLTSIRGYVDLLLSGDAGVLNPLQREFLASASQGIQRLDTVIRTFLARQIDSSPMKGTGQCGKTPEP